MFDYPDGVAGWVCWWRVTLTWQSGQYSPTGEPVQILDVTSPRQLRQLVLAARRDPHIRDYRYFLHRHWDATDASRHCPRGHELMPGQAGGRPCRCGVGHFVTNCHKGAELRLMQPLVKLC